MSWKDFFGIGRDHEVRIDVQNDAVQERAAGTNPLFLAPSRQAVGIGPKEAIRIGTVYRAVNIISTTIAQMEVKVMRGKKEMNYTPAIIKNPIEGESFSSFVQQVVTSLALWGNAYVRIYGTDVEKPSYVRVTDPDEVVCHEDDITGDITYWVRGKVVPNNRIRHLKLDRMPGQLMGHGPLTGSAGVLKAAQLLDTFQRQWFDVTGMPKGVLSTETNLNPEQSSALVEAWNKFIGDHGGTMVMPKGINYESMTIKPAEAQYLEVASANIRDIARIFGIPAANMLSSIDGTSMTYTNYIESNIMFIQNTLSRYIVEIEDFLTSLLPRGQHVNFDEESLLRLSPEKLWQVKKTQFDLGYYSGAEQREEEGKDPLPPVNFDVEGVGGNRPSDKESGVGSTDTKPEEEKVKRCLNDGKPLDGNETLFCSRKCKDEYVSKNKNKGVV